MSTDFESIWWGVGKLEDDNKNTQEIQMPIMSKTNQIMQTCIKKRGRIQKFEFEKKIVKVLRLNQITFHNQQLHLAYKLVQIF